MIGQTVSHYKILEKLGEGGMGVVYKAQDLKLKRTVAIKLLAAELAGEPEATARFIHEAQAASALDHPNICTIYEIDRDRHGQWFIAMACYEGEALKEKIKQGDLKLDEAIDIALQVAQGLAKAHERGIIHRDIKPANLLITPEGTVKILDFGVAKLGGQTRLTKKGGAPGTVAYMSPEQLGGEEVDPSTDIWSLGVVLYEMITGQSPFKGGSEQADTYSILKSRFPESLQKIMDKALKKDKHVRYQSSADLVADLKKEKKNMESGERVFPKPKKWLPFLVPAGIGLAILLYLIFIKKDSEREAVAAENSLAVMYFENLVDPEDRDKTAQMITSLLITDLSESQYMSVVSQQRLYDILNLLGKKDLRVVDKNTASEVAKKVGAKWILTGKVMQAKPTLVVTAEVSEAKGGKILASQKISGTSGEDLFAVVDKLSAEVKKDLSLPAAAKTESDKPVADVTTHSPEAYRNYLEGLDYFDKVVYAAEAEQSFRKALVFDSTFAMAYYRLAGIVGRGEEGKKLIAQAEKYSDKLSQKEKYYLKAREAGLSGDSLKRIEILKKITKRWPDEKEAFWLLGNYYLFGSQKPKEAVRYLTRAIEIDPLYKLPYNELAYAYDKTGDFEKAIRAANKYVSLAPDEANPYDSRGEIYANNGKIELAIESYKRALEIKPDFYSSLDNLARLYFQNGQLDSAIASYKRFLTANPNQSAPRMTLGHLYLFKGDYPRAESCYQAVTSSGDAYWRSKAREGLANISMYQGKFGEALAVLDEGIAADRIDRVAEGPQAFKHVLKADVYREKKDWQRVLDEIRKSMELYHKGYPKDPTFSRQRYVRFLAEKGDVAKAESVAIALKKDIQEKDTSRMLNYWFAAAWIARAKGDWAGAVNNFEKTIKAMAKLGEDFNERCMLAETYLKIGRLAEAVAELEKALSTYPGERATRPIWGVKAYYLLGLAYEKSGWNNKAIKNYEEFLDIWKNADPGIVEVEDAKARLAKLKRKV